MKTTLPINYQERIWVFYTCLIKTCKLSPIGLAYNNKVVFFSYIVSIKHII